MVTNGDGPFVKGRFVKRKPSHHMVNKEEELREAESISVMNLGASRGRSGTR